MAGLWKHLSQRRQARLAGPRGVIAAGVELQSRPKAIGFAGAGRVLGDELRPERAAFVVDDGDLGLLFEQPLALVALHSGHRPATLAPGPVDSRTRPQEKSPAFGPVIVRRRVRPTVARPGAGRLLSSPAPRARPHPPGRSVHLLLLSSPPLLSNPAPVSPSPSTAAPLAPAIRNSAADPGRPQCWAGGVGC